MSRIKKAFDVLSNNNTNPIIKLDMLSVLKVELIRLNNSLDMAEDHNGELKAEIERLKKENGKLNRVVEAANKKHLDLIMEVGKKWPNETRHDTAKRYIREAEASDNKPYMDSTNNA